MASVPSPPSLRPRAGLVSRDFGDEIVVVDEVSEQARTLSGTVAELWRSLDGGPPSELSAARVEEAAAELRRLELVELPAGVSRRALFRRGGVVAAIAAVAAIRAGARGLA